ncbi:MAG TPA: hypothetical protein DCL77_09025 [Prolixibacteraceae bacterium]|nr:hypothetical protein [Prolixibacteraceae bacterium]
MHNMVTLKLQKLNTFAFDEIHPEEIDLILNDAQERIVKQRSDKVTDPKQVGFAGNQKRLNDVRVLITPYSSTITPPTPPPGGEASFSLPSNFFVELSTTIRAKFDVATATASSIVRVTPVRIIENDRYEDDQENPFRKPTISSLPGKMVGNNLVVQCDKRFILVGLRMNYIRMPKKIKLGLSSNSTDCELPQHIHAEIVDLAVSQILEIIESQRYQSSKIEAAQSE